MKVSNLIQRLGDMPEDDEVFVDGLVLEPVVRVERLREGVVSLFLERARK